MGLETMDRLGMEDAAASGGPPEVWDGAAVLRQAQDEGDWDGAGSGEGGGLGLGRPFAAVLSPMELELARKIVGDLAPADAQEEIHAWHLAAAHLLAAERIGKSRQPGLPLRPQQIELGLAVRIMTLGDRKSAALDRHRAHRRKAAEQTAKARKAEEAAEDEEEEMGKTVNKLARARHEARAGFLVTPEELSPEEWTRQARPQQRRLLAGAPEPAGHAEAREELWQERCALAVKKALARGESDGSLRAPYPTDEEVAARADADRRRRKTETEPENVPPAKPPGTERDP